MTNEGTHLGQFYFTVEDATSHAKVVCAEDEGTSSLRANREKFAGAWEAFDVYRNEDETISLKAAANGMFVRILLDDERNGQLLADRREIGETERFVPEPLPDGRYGLRAKATGKYLSVDFDNGGLMGFWRDKVHGEWQSFKAVEIVSASNQSASESDAALSQTRSEIVKPLEELSKLVKRADSGLTASRTAEIEKGIDDLERSIRFDRYRVTVFGAFSAGKSTLINALVGSDFLPSADLPTTNVPTEIFKSDSFYFFIPSDEIKEASLKKMRSEAETEFPRGTFVTSLERDGREIAGVGVRFGSKDSKAFQTAIGQLASEQRRLEKALAGFKKLIKGGHDVVLQLGIPALPEWLGEITLTDAPGAGSVYKGHESVIDEIIPKTQLVLYVVESPKAGSAVDEYLCDRIVNKFHRKVFFILNKIDQQNEDEIADALAELKEHIPTLKFAGSGEPKPPKPEFLTVSALCETLANRMSDGSSTIDELARNKKLSTGELFFSDDWKKATNESEQTQVAVRYLRQHSRFEALRERIAAYLHEENKEFPFCEQAESLIVTVGREMANVASTTAQMLRKDRSAEELAKKQKEVHAKREKAAREAHGVLEDFRESALKPKTGIMAKARQELERIPDEIADSLAKKLEDKNEFKRLTKNKGAELQSWLSREVADRFDATVKATMNELRRQGEHLVERLRPILERIDEASLVRPDDERHDENNPTIPNITRIAGAANVSTGAATGAAAMTGGALATVLGLTIGSATLTTTTTVAGTGLAGALGWNWLAAIGLGTASQTLSTTSTTVFWGLGLGPAFVIVAGVTAALAVAGYFVGRKIRKTIVRKIVAKVRTELAKQIVGDDAQSAASKLNAKVKEFVNASVDGCGNNLSHYLESLDQQEKAMIDEIGKAKKDKTQKAEALAKFGEEIKAFVEFSRQTLRELHPGKDSVHG